MSKGEKSLDTPMMRQYREIKRRYPQEILFFRMGDFYEMFLDDAEYASRVLDIALTRRQDNIPMCGVPWHSVHNYIHPILDSGKRIAMCDQVEDPKSVSGRIVRREVTRILTPGTIFEEELLESGEQRFLAAIVSDGEGGLQVAAVDLSTASLFLERPPVDSLNGYLAARNVREIAAVREEMLELPSEVPVEFLTLAGKSEAEALLRENLNTIREELSLTEAEGRALALIFKYLLEVAPTLSITWKKPSRQFQRDTMVLDDAALRTLEILEDQERNKKHTLLGVLGDTVTTSGKRLLQDWLTRPSMDLATIHSRHETVEFFMRDDAMRGELRDTLRGSADLERILARLENNPQVRHLGEIRHTLEIIARLKEKLTGTLPELITEDWQSELPQNVITLLKSSLIAGELPPVLDERRFVREGYSPELDETITISESAQKILREFEEREKSKYDIPSLRVRYNRVLGYYIEVSRGQVARVPEHYQRRATLVNVERFVTEELQTLEEKILGARDKIIELQRAVFLQIVGGVLAQLADLRLWALRLSRLDVLLSFAHTARNRAYIRPEVSESGRLDLKESRHPVVEAMFTDEVFVPNDVNLDNADTHLIILTGPNMAGKSTYIRQIGLIQIMAQAGSFVPAVKAEIPLVDRIYTRIGAYDRLSRGESTFYVEMVECAHIFESFTENSLILLDEVGRGTSTYDGISIARAMIEYLNQDRFGRPKTLFATHYAELTNLIRADRGIVGMKVEVVETEGRVVFLRKIVPGTADKSYGIYVAEMAGMPREVVDRARELLEELESEGLWQSEPVFRDKMKKADDQLSMF